MTIKEYLLQLKNLPKDSIITHIASGQKIKYIGIGFCEGAGKRNPPCKLCIGSARCKNIKRSITSEASICPIFMDHIGKVIPTFTLPNLDFLSEDDFKL